MVIVQFDVLWESLSAREHLHVFGSLKGLSGADIGRVSFDHKSILSFFCVFFFLQIGSLWLLQVATVEPWHAELKHNVKP